MQRERMFGFSVVLALSLLVLHGVASASVEGTIVPTDMTPANIVPTDMASEAQTTMVRLEASRSTVRRMLEEARAQRDVIKTLCLDDKLNQIDVALRNARDRKTTIGAAMRQNDVDLARHDFTVLGVLRQRSEQLVAEANLCIGKEVDSLGEVATISTVDPSIVDEPAYYPPGVIIVEPPPAGSIIK